MKVLVTGSAGFIGFHLTKALLERGDTVYGWDNISSYYDEKLKLSRLDQLSHYPQFEFQRVDISNRPQVEAEFRRILPTKVVNLAAQAGVRYSLTNPHAYVDANVTGFLNILEGCRHNPVEHLVFASTSSVYGANQKLPFSTSDSTNHPVSLYAATKKANELFAHSYSHLYGIPTTGLRFFTVYGPWGRPDMALFLFTKNIVEGKPIDVFNYGKHQRDFTYIDDIIRNLVAVLDKPATPNPKWDGLNPAPDSSAAPYRLYNIGNHSPVMLGEFIEAIEDAVGKKAIRNLVPMQAGDVKETHADIESLIQDFGLPPQVSVREGVGRFVEWYRSYYQVV